MLTRRTARVLLLDGAGRLLLVHMHHPDFAAPGGAVSPTPYWVTVGGAAEPDEDIAAAALREIAEETGLTRVRLGPAIWYDEHMAEIRGQPTLVQQTFFLAWTEETELSNKAWTQEERTIIKGMKWWTLEELLATNETLYPSSLPMHLSAILAGDYPRQIAPIEF
jgi:8-oxo-dGTP pyrophosphatase MutT (NUDIX family)